MGNKMQFELLEHQIGLLLEVDFCDTDNRSIQKHCKYIAEYIVQNGWTEEDYNREFVKRGLAEFSFADMSN